MIVQIKGDAYLVDKNVTGSDEGTSNDPKFSFMTLFCDQVFPKIAELVLPGGTYCGYRLPVIQGDNPQMPRINNLDLDVFPMMSKSHSSLLKMYSNLQDPHEEI